MVMTGYPVVPPSQLVGRIVLAQVSHTEEDVFWIQTEPDRVAALVVGVAEQGAQRVVDVGECVMGRWEGDWYRGVVMEGMETEVVVQFVDWGYSATLARENVRKSVEKEMGELVGAVKCRLVGKEMEGWEEELLQADYMVKLRCLAHYGDIFLMTKELCKSLSLPMQQNIPGTVGDISEDRDNYKDEEISRGPAHLQTASISSRSRSRTSPRTSTTSRSTASRTSTSVNAKYATVCTCT